MKKNSSIIHEISFGLIAKHHYVPWVIALLFFLLAALLIALSFFNGSLSEWQKNSTHTVSIEFPITEKITPKIQADILSKVQKNLRHLEGLKKVSVVEPLKIKKLLEPWLGNTENLDDINLPLLIDLEFSSNAIINTQKITDLLQPINSKIHVEKLPERHQGLNYEIPFVNTVLFILVCLIAFSIIFLSFAVIRLAMVIQGNNINALRLMGAKHSYIAGQFQQQTLYLYIRGMLISCCFLSLFAFFIMGFRYYFNIQTHNFAFSYTPLIAAFIIPLIVALISSFITRFTVLKFLKNLNHDHLSRFC